MTDRYVHGYDSKESERLLNQANSVLDLIHADTTYPACSAVLEVGCGTGAQTMTLARNSPEARVISFDVSARSLREAKLRLDSEGLANRVEFVGADLFALPFPERSFDHIFVCFVLEHLSHPIEALTSLKKLMKPRGTITVFEGDHGSTYFHPDSVEAHEAIRCLIELQRRGGGNANIGRQLYPLLQAAGFDSVRVSPRMVYVDSSRPHLVDGFTRKTFTAMIEGVRNAAISQGMIKLESFDAGIQDLYRTAEADGVFCYTFFKGVAKK